MTKADRELVSLMQRLRLSCPACRYDLSAAETPICPECGKHVHAEDYRVKAGLPKNNWLVAAIVGACQLLIIGPAATVAIMVKSPMPTSAEGAIVLASVFACGWVLWFVSYRPLRVLALPTMLKWCVLAGLAVLGPVMLLALIGVPAWLVGDAFGWW